MSATVFTLCLHYVHSRPFYSRQTHPTGKSQSCDPAKDGELSEYLIKVGKIYDLGGIEL